MSFLERLVLLCDGCGTPYVPDRERRYTKKVRLRLAASLDNWKVGRMLGKRRVDLCATCVKSGPAWTKNVVIAGRDGR